MDALEVFWYGVWEMILPVVKDGAETGQYTNQKWTRSGGVAVQSGQTTAELVAKIAEAGAQDPTIPEGALLVDFNLYPQYLNPM